MERLGAPARRSVLLLICILNFALADSLFADGGLRLDVFNEGNQIVGEVEIPSGTSEIEWLILSDRNARIEMLDERSPRAPKEFPDRPRVEGASIWFPTIDIEIVPGLEAEAEFDGVASGDEVYFNGHFLDHSQGLESIVRLTGGFEHWENQIYVKSQYARLTKFSFRKRESIEAGEEKTRLKVTPLSPNWNGTIGVMTRTASGEWAQGADIRISMEDIDSEPASVAVELDRQSVVESLRSTVRYLMASRNLNPQSPTYGGLYLFFDRDADTFRRSDWMWSYGPAIKLLLDSSTLPEVYEVFGYEHMREAARGVAEASLRFQIKDAKHPAAGLVVCRIDPRFDSPRGAEGFCSPADSLFLAGWGWIPYFETSGDERFLEATQLMVENIDRILELDPLIEQDYLLREGKWKNWTMDESGFGMRGFEALYTVSGDSRVREIGARYLDGLLDHLEREDGLWDRTWHRNDPAKSDNGWKVNATRGEPVLIKTKFSTRGLGWAMIGLLSANRLMPDGSIYLDKAIALSDHLLAHQADDGHWDFLFKEPQYQNEISAKGTALWSLLFYELYAETGNPHHLQAARKSLLWCMRNRYLGKGLAVGGIPEVNRESGVIYRRWNELICGYTMSWFGLALLEELELKQL